MPVIVDFKVQLLCQTCSSFRRGRRHFKPFAGPVAFTQDRVRTRDYASSAVLSTADNTHTTNTRPLQEQLRDQMDLYKLQRAGLPEDAQIESPKTPSKRKLKASKDQAFDSKAKQPGRPAGNTKKRRASRSTQPAGRTAVQGRKRVADSDQAVTDPAAQGASLKPNTTRPRTLSKQEDTALCSAIKDAAFIEQQRQMVYSIVPQLDSAGDGDAAVSQPNVPMKGEDYQRLKQWKDAVGAPTFSQLHTRRDRGERAKTMLLHYNKGLVHQFVWRCKRMGTDVAFGELVLAGDEALLKAALQFDAQKGARFSTYAFQRINRAIVRYIMEHEDVIKIPVHLKELQAKIKHAQTKLVQKLGRPPSPQEVAKHLQQPVARVILAMRKAQAPVTVDAQPADDEKDSLVDLLAASIDEDGGQESLNSVMHRQFASDVEGVLELLPHREGEVLALRYGLFNGEPQSLTDVANILKLSIEAVRKNELSAFRRLREAGRLQPLMAYLRDTEAHGNGLESTNFSKLGKSAMA